MSITNEVLADGERLLSVASPRPWEKGTGGWIYPAVEYGDCGSHEAAWSTEHDRPLVLWAVNNAPTLIAEVRALRDEVDALRAELAAERERVNIGDMVERAHAEVLDGAADEAEKECERLRGENERLRAELAEARR